MYKCKTPVAIIVFNRPDSAKQIFEEVKKVQPPQLFIIADGARENKTGEKEKCLEAQKIATMIDWDCVVKTNFSEMNLGCKNRVASGIDWVFEHTETAIILEDDCKPCVSFFKFCDEMLEKYKNDERIMVVSGNNKLFDKAEPKTSYYFSRYINLWGWATWKRAWKHNDLKMPNWETVFTKKMLRQYIHLASELYYWESLFDAVYKNRIDTWDYQWVYNIWINSGCAIVPKVNLISNIGFTAEATHTKSNSIFSQITVKELDFPLIHPKSVLIDVNLDDIERKIRKSDQKNLPYPINKWASKLKWFLIEKLKRK